MISVALFQFDIHSLANQNPQSNPAVVSFPFLCRHKRPPWLIIYMIFFSLPKCSSVLRVHLLKVSHLKGDGIISHPSSLQRKAQSPYFYPVLLLSGCTNLAEHFSLDGVSMKHSNPAVYTQKNSVCFVKDYPFINTPRKT